MAGMVSVRTCFEREQKNAPGSVGPLRGRIGTSEMQNDSSANLTTRLPPESAGTDTRGVIAGTLPPIRFTIFTNNVGRLTKRLYLDAKGKLQKEHGGLLYDGHAIQVSATSLRDLVECLDELDTNQAVCWGVGANDQARIASKNLMDRIEGSIQRNDTNFAWNVGPGIWMLDIDGNHDPQEAYGQLIEAMPELKTCEMVWRPSASAYLFHAETGAKLSGCVGGRFYVPVDAANKIPDLGKTLSVRLWQKGHGRIDLSASGTMLPRTLVDEAVWRSSGLDFVAPPVCEHPVVRRPHDPIYFGDTGVHLNTALKGFKWATHVDAEDKARLIGSLKGPRESAAREKRRQWAEQKAQEYVGQEEQAKEFLQRAAEGMVLPREFQINLANGEVITVHEILTNGSKYDGMYCEDPLEPEKGAYKARINTRGREPLIYSWIHGGIEYALANEREYIEPKGVNERDDAILVGDAIGRKFNDLYSDAKEEAILRVTSTGMQCLGTSSLAMVLSSRLQFRKYDSRKKKMVASYWPSTLLSLITSPKNVPELGLRPLKAVVNRPFMRRTGDLVQELGYDPGAQVVYANSAERFPRIRDRPTKADAEAALKVLLKPVSGFHPVDDFDQAGITSLLLSAVVTGTIQSPITIVTSEGSGSGKTTLGEVAALLAGTPTSRLFPALLPEREDEQEKTIPALYNDPVTRAVIYDNVDRAISGGLIEQTSSGGDSFEFRPFGSNTDMKRIELTKLIVFNGIGARTGNPAMARRSITINLVPGSPFDWAKRVKEKRSPTDPKGYVADNYVDLVTAGLTVLRGYVAAGCPRDGMREETLGGFLVWDRFVRGAVHWLTGVDVMAQVLDNFEDVAGKADTGKRGRLYRMAYNRFGGASFSHAQLKKAVGDEKMMGPGENPKTWASWSDMNSVGGLALKRVWKKNAQGVEVPYEVSGVAMWQIVGTPDDAVLGGQ